MERGERRVQEEVRKRETHKIERDTESNRERPDTEIPQRESKRR